MEWLNPFGLVFMILIMIPNIIFAVKHKDGFENRYKNKTAEVLEQIGRFGCFGFMVLNIPGTWFGWSSNEAFALYLIVNTLLTILYCLLWIICWKKNNLFKALSLSILPSCLFLFSGIMSRSILLIISALLFTPTHILISCRNVRE